MKSMGYSSVYRVFNIISANRLVVFRTASNKPVKTIINAQGKDVPKRKTFESRITLISPDNSVSITDLKNAQSLSLRRELKLIKIQDEDSKTRRPVYKLMTNAEYHSEEIARRKEKQGSQEKKGEKLITLSSRIGEHDLMTGARKMLKLVEKQHEVRVVITADDAHSSEKLEKIYSVIENQVKSIANIVQKRMKGSSLRFQLLPLRTNSTQRDSTDSNPTNNDKGPL